MKITLALLPVLAVMQPASSVFAEIHIRDYPPPGVAVNGAVVPTEATFSPPLRSGESLAIEAAGIEALRIEVIEGEIAKISTRVKLAESGEIVYRRAREGVAQESAARSVRVQGGEAPSGAATVVEKGSDNLRERVMNGLYRLLVRSSNGFGSTLVLRDSGFHVRVTGTNALSNSFVLEVGGSFSEALTSTFESAAPATPR